MQEMTIELKNKEDIYLLGNFVGRLSEERVLNLLRNSDRNWFDKALRDILTRIVHDTGRCPVCGGREFIEKLVVDTVCIGYCNDCQEQVAIGRDNLWLSVWHEEHRQGYRRVVDLLHKPS